jgi:hypothetical protein
MSGDFWKTKLSEYFRTSLKPCLFAKEPVSRLRQIPESETDDGDYNDGICYKHKTVVISLRRINELRVEMVLYLVDQCTCIDHNRCFHYLVE